jgi:hypothetical protein
LREVEVLGPGRDHLSNLSFIASFCAEAGSGPDEIFLVDRR